MQIDFRPPPILCIIFNAVRLISVKHSGTKCVLSPFWNSTGIDQHASDSVTTKSDDIIVILKTLDPGNSRSDVLISDDLAL